MIDINPFPPLIFKENFQFSDVHLTTAKRILNNCQSNSHLEKGNAKSSVADQDYAPHTAPEFADFFAWVYPKATDIIHNKFFYSNEYDYYIGNSWINMHGFSGNTIQHNHGMSSLSIVAYLKVPENSGFTEFKDPFYDFKNLHEQRDDLLMEWVPVPVEEGDVLMFPGWLPHRSGTNQTTSERWILSANFINFVLYRPYNLQNFIKV